MSSCLQVANLSSHAEARLAGVQGVANSMTVAQSRPHAMSGRRLARRAGALVTDRHVRLFLAIRGGIWAGVALTLLWAPLHDPASIPPFRAYHGSRICSSGPLRTGTPCGSFTSRTSATTAAMPRLFSRRSARHRNRRARPVRPPLLSFPRILLADFPVLLALATVVQDRPRLRTAVVLLFAFTAAAAA